MKARATLIGVIVLAAAGGWSLYALAPASEQLEYTFATVEPGDIESVVVSSGTLRALNTVIVGSQLSGQIAELHADFNDTVAAGDLVARIDPRTFEARVQQNRADVTVALANIESRKAELVRATATLGQARRELERRRALVDRGYISASELDQDVTLVETSEAQVAIARAAITNAEANLEQRRAALSQAELDLERTYIRSPVSGTVINRQIEVGQTVAASFTAPVLFEVGENLRRMQVEASVDEADIGRVREGLQCRFTVDSYPDRQFRGRIEQVRKAPEELQNVVTYKVIVTAANDDLALLPGMTAHVEMILGSRSDVLKIPNAALRFAPRGVRTEEPATESGRSPFGPGGGGPPGGFRPGGPGGSPVAAIREQFDLTPDQSALLDAIEERQRTAVQAAFQGSGGDRALMRERMRSLRANLRHELATVLDADQLRSFDALQAGRAERRRATVWTFDDGEPTPRRVVTGLADEESTEVREGLAEGDRVIVRATRRPG
ncbi:MAG: efflux RND transporter periplasmic adaptor subunit [Gammaproteobacteria bacterium]|nr:efflux RND transporter periplasmic adaptor subunit [Gammaproteobacteria bacterium]